MVEQSQSEANFTPQRVDMGRVLRIQGFLHHDYFRLTTLYLQYTFSRTILFKQSAFHKAIYPSNRCKLHPGRSMVDR